MPSQAPGSDSPRPKCRRRLRWRTWSTSEDLPEPETPVTQTRSPSGRSTVTSLRLFSRAPRTRRRLAGSGRRRRVGPGIARRPARYAPVFERGSVEQARDRALVDHLAALAAGAGAEVDHVVGGGDEGRVVLDHHHGVARVGQPAQDADELLRVARVQAHRRLVEDVERARERAAERGGEGHALGLAAREGPRLAPEGQVAEAHVHEEAQPPAHLVQELLGGGVLPGHAPLAEDALRLGHRQRLDLGERAPGEPEEPRLGLEARAAAVGARPVAAVAREEDAHVHPVGAGLEPLEEAARRRTTSASSPGGRPARRPTGGASSRRGDPRTARPRPGPRAGRSAPGRPGSRCRSSSGTASRSPGGSTCARRGSPGRARWPSSGRSPCRSRTRPRGG